VFSARKSCSGTAAAPTMARRRENRTPREQTNEVTGRRPRRHGWSAIDAGLPRRRIKHDLNADDKVGFARVLIGADLNATLGYIQREVLYNTSHGERALVSDPLRLDLGAQPNRSLRSWLPLKRHILASAVIFEDDDGWQ